MEQKMTPSETWKALAYVNKIENFPMDEFGLFACLSNWTREEFKRKYPDSDSIFDHPADTQWISRHSNE